MGVRLEGKYRYFPSTSSHPSVLTRVTTVVAVSNVATWPGKVIGELPHCAGWVAAAGAATVVGGVGGHPEQHGAHLGEASGEVLVTALHGLIVTSGVSQVEPPSKVEVDDLSSYMYKRFLRSFWRPRLSIYM